MTKQIVLKLLREHTEEFLSGEAISRQAGVSRAAVWKAVEQLRQEGYGIESVPNRGYRLTRVTARLRPEELSEQFRDRRIGRELLYFDTIDSTNNELKRRAVSGHRRWNGDSGRPADRRPGDGGDGALCPPPGRDCIYRRPSAPGARSLRSAP